MIKNITTQGGLKSCARLYILEYKYHIMKIKQRITWPSFIICSRENINHEKDKGRRWEYKDKIHVDNAFVRIKFQVNIHHEKNLY